MSSVIARPAGYRPATFRCKDLLPGPPLATSRLARERLRRLVALAVFSSDAVRSTAYGTGQIMLVLVDGLDRAVQHALQYAGQLNPLSVTAVHVAADPGSAGRLTKLWVTLPLAVPLEVVHCPNRDLATHPSGP
jgi:hypothetical protein